MSDEKYVVGRIYKRPMQRDMFTGNLVKSQPKAGRGNHIILKDDNASLAKIPGMAYFPGTSPDGKRCEHCAHLENLPCFGRKRAMTRELAGLKEDTQPRRIEDNARRLAAQMRGGVVQSGGIQFERACKYFKERQVETAD